MVSRRIEPVSVTLPDYGITAFSSRHGRAFRMSVMSNAFHKIVVVIEGSGAIEAGNRTIALEPNTVVRTTPHQAHRFVDEPTQPMTLAVLCLSPGAAGKLFRPLWPQVVRQILAGRAAVISQGYAAEIYSLNRQIAVEASAFSPQANWMISALAMQTMVQLLRGIAPSHSSTSAPAGTAFAGTVLWLDRHFTQPVSITELADRAGMSYRSFTSHFLRQTGMTVTDYVNRRRIGVAVHLIQSGSDILHAAFESGFSDISHFYRMCKKQTGRTPGQLQQR